MKDRGDYMTDIGRYKHRVISPGELAFFLLVGAAALLALFSAGFMAAGRGQVKDHVPVEQPAAVRSVSV